MNQKKEIKCMLVGIKEYEQLKQENKRLKEALRKCSPMDMHYTCEFCGDTNGDHDIDCEYMKLTEREGE